jgi:small-conductance mechanosensitive channel
VGPRTGPWLLAAAFAVVVAGPVAAQVQLGSDLVGEAGAPENDPTDPAEIQSRLDRLSEELAGVEARLASASGVERAHLEEVRERLRATEALLRRQADMHAPAPDTTAADLVPPDLEPSVFALYQLEEAKRDAVERRSRLEETLDAGREALTAARDVLEKTERARREARAELESAEDEAERVRAERALELRQLASRAARERVHLRSLELRAAESRLQRAEADRDGLSELDDRVAAMRSALASGGGTSDAGFADLRRQEGELRRRHEEVERRLASAEVRLESAQQRFSRQEEPDESLLERVENLAARRDAVRQELALIDAQLERLDARRALWRRWEQLLTGAAPADELEAWKGAAIARAEALEQARLQREAQREDLRRRTEVIDSRIATLADDEAMQSALEQQRTALSRLLEEHRREADDLARDRRISERFVADLRDQTGEVDLVRHVTEALQAARDVWRYEITSVEDSPITVGSLVLALVLFGVGMWTSRRGAGLVGHVASQRFKLDTGAAQALETLSFYVLLISFTLLALRAVHFPLTAFTVLGGALAIGIGFGSQNVMNNFISGLILMLERPVRAGDFVEVDGNHGSIEKIGARSTQIRSVDGRHIVVPNSYFLESNVVNWTLSDDLIRTHVVVGVIYGSPTRLVEQLIRQVVDEDPDVIRHPEPVLLFEEFGDNSLNFEVHFWVRARSPMATRKVKSRVRFRIDDLFREHGLVIAFPQRDVHLDSASPIEVRVVSGAAAGPRSPER